MLNPCTVAAGNPYKFRYKITDGWGTGPVSTYRNATITLSDCNKDPTARADPHGATAGNAIRYQVTEDVALSILPTLSSGPSFTACNAITKGLLCNDDDPNGALGHNATLIAVGHTVPSLGTLADVDATNTLAKGAFKFTPTANRCGEATFDYMAQDVLEGQSNVATAYLKIACTHDLPTPAADGFSISEDCGEPANTPCAAPISFATPCPGMSRAKQLLCNDSDPDDLNAVYEATKGIDDAIVELVTGPTMGVLSLSADGSFTYKPNANAFGTDSFVYRLKDGATGTTNGATATITISIASIPDNPIGNADTFTTIENDVLVVDGGVGVLLNDQDADPTDTLQAVGFSNWNCPTAPATGTLTASGLDGGFTFTPPSNFVGACTFTYRAKSVPDNLESADTTVTINVITAPPIYARSDTLTLNEDCSTTAATSCATPFTLAAPGILANDITQSGPAIQIVIVQAPTKGGLSVQNDGSLIFTPNPNANGADFFRYQIKQDLNGDGDTLDADEVSNTVASRITINPINDIPVALAKTYLMDEDCTASVDVSSCAAPLTASDLLAGATDPNDTPANAPLYVQVSGMCGTATVATPLGTSLGTVTGLTATGDFTYTPNPNANGVDTFQYCVVDALGGVSAPATVTITVRPVADRPVAKQDPGGVPGACASSPTYLAYVGHDLIVPFRSYQKLTANDVDPDTPNGDVVQVDLGSVNTAGMAGSLVSVSLDGSFVYRPPTTGSWPIVTQFTYSAKSTQDNLVSASAAVVCIKVQINPPPVASFTTSAATAVEGQSIGFTDTSTDTAPGVIEGWYWQFGDGQTSTEQNPTHRYDSPGTYTVRLVVTDDVGDTSETIGSVSIQYPPDPNASGPGASPLRANAGADAQFISGDRVVLGGSAVGAVSPRYQWTQTAGPVVSMQGAQTATPSFVAPPVLANAELKFSLVVSDGGRSSEADSVTIRVIPGNRAPVVAVAGPRSGNPGQNLDFDASSTQDPDGDTLSFTWTQVEGPSVQLTGEPNGAARSFTIPTGSEGQVIRLRVVASDGRLSGTSEIVVLVKAAGSTIEGFEAGKARADGSVQFRAMLAGVNMVWDFGDDSPRSRLTDPVHRYKEAGTYVVTYQVTLADGSVQTFRDTVTIDSIVLSQEVTPVESSSSSWIAPTLIVVGVVGIGAGASVAVVKYVGRKK